MWLIYPSHLSYNMKRRMCKRCQTWWPINRHSQGLGKDVLTTHTGVGIKSHLIPSCLFCPARSILSKAQCQASVPRLIPFASTTASIAMMTTIISSVSSTSSQFVGPPPLVWLSLVPVPAREVAFAPRRPRIETAVLRLLASVRVGLGSAP